MHITTFLQGGAGRIITELACAQKTAGHQVVVLADNQPTAGYETYPLYRRQLESAGIPLMETASFFRRDLSLNVAAAQQVREIAEKWSINIIHAHAAIPALTGLIGRSSLKSLVPVILSMHGFGDNKTKDQIKTDVAIMNLVDVVVPVSKASANHLGAIGVRKQNLEVIYNAVQDRGHSPPLPRQLERDLLWRQIAAWQSKNTPIIGCIGSVGKRKNQACLIKALSNLHDIQYICLLVGEEEEPGKIQELIVSTGLQEKILVTGYRDDAAELLNIFTLMVLPSRNEGLPLTVLEAFRDGIPVLGSNIAPIEEIVTDDVTGKVFLENDDQDLARILELFFSGKYNTDKWIDNAATLFQERYSMPSMVSSFDNLYKRLYQQYATIRMA